MYVCGGRGSPWEDGDGCLRDLVFVDFVACFVFDIPPIHSFLIVL